MAPQLVIRIRSPRKNTELGCSLSPRKFSGETPIWIQLKSLRSPEQICGHFLVSIALQANKRPRKPRLQLDFQKQLARIFIYQAIYVPSMDKEPLPSTKLFLSLAAQSDSTTTIEHSLSPEWNELLELVCFIPKDLNLATPLTLKVSHFASRKNVKPQILNSEDVLVGQESIPVSYLYQMELTHPEWFVAKSQEFPKYCWPKILMGFKFQDPGLPATMPEFDFVPIDIHLYILGLRLFQLGTQTEPRIRICIGR